MSSGNEVKRRFIVTSLGFSSTGKSHHFHPENGVFWNTITTHLANYQRVKDFHDKLRGKKSIAGITKGSVSGELVFQSTGNKEMTMSILGYVYKIPIIYSHELLLIILDYPGHDHSLAYQLILNLENSEQVRNHFVKEVENLKKLLENILDRKILDRKLSLSDDEKQKELFDIIKNILGSNVITAQDFPFRNFYSNDINDDAWKIITEIVNTQEGSFSYNDFRKDLEKNGEIGKDDFFFLLNIMTYWFLYKIYSKLAEKDKRFETIKEKYWEIFGKLKSLSANHKVTVKLEGNNADHSGNNTVIVDGETMWKLMYYRLIVTVPITLSLLLAFTLISDGIVMFHPIHWDEYLVTFYTKHVEIEGESLDNLEGEVIRLLDFIRDNVIEDNRRRCGLRLDEQAELPNLNNGSDLPPLLSKIFRLVQGNGQGNQQGGDESSLNLYLKMMYYNQDDINIVLRRINKLPNCRTENLVDLRTKINNFLGSLDSYQLLYDHVPFKFQGGFLARLLNAMGWMSSSRKKIALFIVASFFDKIPNGLAEQAFGEYRDNVMRTGESRIIYVGNGNDRIWFPRINVDQNFNQTFADRVGKVYVVPGGPGDTSCPNIPLIASILCLIYETLEENNDDNNPCKIFKLDRPNRTRNPRV